MARTKLNQRSANRVDVPVGVTGGRPPSKVSIVVLVISILAAIWAAGMLTPFGRVGYYFVYLYSEYYFGVITLVSLSVTIMIGLVATDRLVLSIRQRVLMQSAHRTTGVIAVAGLFVHVWTKYTEEHIRLLDIVVPFIAPFNTLYVGFGTLSGLIMVLVMWTGLARARFVGRGKPWMWRGIHAISYLMWPIALVHGLAAGRAAATWVIVSYVVCVLLVLVGLAVRLSVSLNRRKDFSSTATGAMKPIGAVVPTQPPAKPKKPARRERVVEDTPAAPAQWVPAGGPRPVSAAPAVAPAMAGFDEPRGGRYAEEERTPRRGRRYADEDAPPVTPRQRRAETERYDEPTGPISRRGLGGDRVTSDERDYSPTMESPMARGRRYAEDDEPTPRGRRYADDRDDYAATPPPAPRGRRYADDDVEPPARRGRRYADEDDQPRGHRYADEDSYEPGPRPRSGMPLDPRTTGEFRTGDYNWREDTSTRASRSPRYADDDEDAPRARRDRGADDDRADSGRHSRSEFVDLAAPADPWRVQDDDQEPDETPTLVDMASRRARREAQQQDPTRPASRGARRGGRPRTGEDAAEDAQYWRQLRGEAQ